MNIARNTPILKLLATTLAATLLPAAAALAQDDWLKNLGRQSLQAENTDFLPVEQAYPFSYLQQGKRLTLNWNIQPGYYMYRRSFRFPDSGVSVADSQLPNGNVVDDIEYGITEVYEEPLNMELSLANEVSEITIEFQGCAKAGLCYPPTQHTVFVEPVSGPGKKSPIKLNNTEALRARIGAGLPAMLQLTADWSAASKLMQRDLFQKTEVINALQPLHWLQADVTDRSNATTLLAEFSAAGPDTFIFYSATGEERLRLAGRQSAESLLTAVQQLNNSEIQ